MNALRRSQASTDRGQRLQLLRRIEAVLECPECRAPLAETSREAGRVFRCVECDAAFPARNGQLVFSGLADEAIDEDWLNRAKESAKRRLEHLTPIAIRLLSPVHGRGYPRRFVESFDTDVELVVDLGAGTNDYGDQVVCVDGADYPSVHVVTDLGKLPFQDDSFSGVLSVAVMEHLRDPDAHVREIRRILKPGGRVLCFVPFMQGFHASPYDFQRYTQNGLRELFSGFEVIHTSVGAGPTSGLIWVLQEWLALVLSLGSRRLYRLLVPLTWILSPLKYFDVLLARHPDADVIASANVIEARKPLGETVPAGADR